MAARPADSSGDDDSQDALSQARARSGPSGDALTHRASARDAVRIGAGVGGAADPGGLTGIECMVAPTTLRLERIHHHQIDRAPWPDFTAFDRDTYPADLRRAAAIQWAGRARAEYGSIHQFTQVGHAMCEVRLGVQLLGALSRLITDEVRHAEICAQMALACDPEARDDHPAVLRWSAPTAPWRAPPRASARPTRASTGAQVSDTAGRDVAADPGPDGLRAWIAEAVLVACCLGETLSRPMLEAIVEVATDDVAAAVARQILRDEHLHAAFGWDVLALLLPTLDAAAIEQLESRLSSAFAGFQASTACGIGVEEVAGTAVEIVRGPPNLGTLSDHQYAMIFYATIESEIIPALEALGLEATRAWRLRDTRTTDRSR